MNGAHHSVEMFSQSECSVEVVSFPPLFHPLCFLSLHSCASQMTYSSTLLFVKAECVPTPLEAGTVHLFCYCCLFPVLLSDHRQEYKK